MYIENEPEHKHSTSLEQVECFSARLNESIKGESLRSFARRSNLSETVLRKYLGGESTPNVERLVALAKAANVSVTWLATGEVLNQVQESSLFYNEDGKTDESQRLQEDQWQQQQEKFKQGMHLMFEMSKDDPNYNPDGVWSALLVELLAMHGLHESGYQRILDTLKMLKKRNIDKKGDVESEK